MRRNSSSMSPKFGYIASESMYGNANPSSLSLARISANKLRNGASRTPGLLTISWQFSEVKARERVRTFTLLSYSRLRCDTMLRCTMPACKVAMRCTRFCDGNRSYCTTSELGSSKWTINARRTRFHGAWMEFRFLSLPKEPMFIS